MPITTLDSAIAALSFRPKGIKVGFELFCELKKAGRIKVESRLTGLKGSNDLEYYVLDGDIYVYLERELSDFEYVLPTA